MSIQYDDKGKFFTEVVSKVAVYVTIQTTTHRLRGRIHIRRDQRIKDELNYDERFLALTDATVFHADGSVLYETPFLAVQRDGIVWVLPEPNSNEGKS